jgi:hypothetical protein
VLDEGYLSDVERAQRAFTHDASPVPAELVFAAGFANADAEDRQVETTGAVKLVASLAAVDGLVLMTPELSVVGFGAKIGLTPNVATVYDGAGFARRGARAPKIDLSQFGTRHGSMLRYCARDHKALGIVVSQDGYVRLIMTVKNSLVFWDNIKLLDYDDFSRQEVTTYKEFRHEQKLMRASGGHGFRLGYTDMPKTVHHLMKAATSQQRKNTSAESATKPAFCSAT